MNIAAGVRNINQTSNAIEQDILIKTTINTTLHRYIDSEISKIEYQLPTPQYHTNLHKNNNINKTHLVDLLLEAHYAMSFYYNSIKNILQMHDPFGSSTNEWFRHIKSDLEQKVICSYRNVLNVYSSEWPLTTEISRIKFSSRIFEIWPSILHDARAIIIAQLLSEWMTRINSAIITIEQKFR
ncbi:unnamed protein product [Adineta steineri]|uniref:Uncharacterized protein n=1 Tax=Adineta steineri TaxID=433720 RepID=A0A820BEU1_9BILA|nr:unnamed protein product [Adineta steineri]CAF4197813.1 unnamed protein product [Adineta steineri]